MLTQQMVAELFTYRAGWLYWKIDLGQRARKGRRAGSLSGCGYYHVQVNRVKYPVHRLIFLLHHGYLPVEIDHINRDRGDNRIRNLRAATRSDNMKNRAVSRASTSGIKGVTWRKEQKCWRVRVCIDGKTESLGGFTSLASAETAARNLRELMHKEFARHA